MQEVADSRQQTEEQLRELRAEERSIFDSLENSDGTLKDKILRLAQVIEERINLLDPMLAKDLTISRISSTITRQLRALNMPFSHWVSEYLPNKYKNPNIHKHAKLIIDLKNLLDASVEPTELIEQCSNIELESLVQYIDKAKNTADDVVTILKNRKERALQEAINRGMQEIGGEKIRDQISERDYRYDIPEYFGLDELNQEVTLQGNRWIKALDVFFNKKYPDRPGHIRQEVFKWAHALRVIANVHEVINEDKWSGDMSFWFDREYHAKIQSKHDAGNSTMFPSTLCANCSKNVSEDPKDCVKMKYWRPSPTGYICGQCGGTKIKERENTREQVGDKEGDVFHDASDVLNHIPFYADVFIEYVEKVKSPPIYARKTAIAGPFSKSAIGGVDKIVVPRKKKKYEYDPIG